jgi:DNA-binding winged helix-turn-helix (wHTH) protein
VRNRGRVVSKDDIRLGRIVSDSALTTRLNAARKATNDSGAAQCVIRTVRGKGVRFIGARSASRRGAKLVGDRAYGPRP